MLNREQLIGSINKNCKYHFQKHSFSLNLSTRAYNSFYYKTQGTSYAINRHKNNSEKVKVLNWFEDFWLYVEIKFISDNTFISISVFQGEEGDENKHQLFRAEWDDTLMITIKLSVGFRAYCII